jgi:hypothetical protein
MDEYKGRLDDPRMEHYKHVYKESQVWTPDEGSLDGKTVIVYGEQGYGDIIQFARYLPLLRERGASVVYHCPKVMHQLFGLDIGGWQDIGLLDKDNPELPPHDYHILSMSLPFVLGQQRTTEFPYLKVEETADLGDESEDVKKIGICWEGGPNNPDRNCPLEYFKALECPYTKLIMLQKDITDLSLLERCDDMDLYGHEINNFYDTAKIINSLDMVITVDTAVLHLAGALNKLTYAILNLEHDSRWDIETWYPSVICVKLKEHNNWPAAFKTVIYMCTGLLTERDPDKDFVDDIMTQSHV